MTPRSVQIWFQNRRQRLLKPSLRGEGGDAIGGDELGGVPEGDPAVASATHTCASLADLSRPDRPGGDFAPGPHHGCGAMQQEAHGVVGAASESSLSPNMHPLSTLADPHGGSQ